MPATVLLGIPSEFVAVLLTPPNLSIEISVQYTKVAATQYFENLRIVGPASTHSELEHGPSGLPCRSQTLKGRASELSSWNGTPLEAYRTIS
eukprot:4404599-Amphidinium_carterae.1